MPIPLPARILSFIFVFALLLNYSVAGKKNKKSNRGPEEKTITAKVSLYQDRHQFGKGYKIGNLLVGRSSIGKVKDFDGKTVKAKCRIHKGIIVRIYEIEEAPKPQKKKKKKKWS